jgi:hypothetical protein
MRCFIAFLAERKHGRASAGRGAVAASGPHQLSPHQQEERIMFARAHRRVFVIVCLAVCLLASPSYATFHLWDITEVHSSAGGEQQFIEMHTDSPGQEFTSGATITTNDNVYTFEDPTPSPTTNRDLLLATPGFTALTEAGVTPDFEIPANFFDPSGDTIVFEKGAQLADSETFGALPSDPSLSLNRTAGNENVTMVAPATPTNFAGDTTSIPEPASATLFGLSATMILVGGRRRRRQA